MYSTGRRRAERSEQAPWTAIVARASGTSSGAPARTKSFCMSTTRSAGAGSRSAGGTSAATRAAGAASIAAILAGVRGPERAGGVRYTRHPMPTAETSPAAPRDVEDLEERLSRPTPGGRRRPRGGRWRHHDARRRREDGADARADGAPRRARPADPRRRPLQRPGGRDGARGARRRADPRRPARPRGDRAPAARPERDPDGRPQVRHQRRAVAHVGDEHHPPRVRRGGDGRQPDRGVLDRQRLPVPPGRLPAGRRRTSRSCRRPATTPRAASGASGCCAGTPRRAARRA